LGDYHHERHPEQGILAQGASRLGDGRSPVARSEAPSRPQRESVEQAEARRWQQFVAQHDGHHPLEKALQAMAAKTGGEVKPIMWEPDEGKRKEKFRAAWNAFMTKHGHDKYVISEEDDDNAG
jgi:hypothetical protein